MSAHDIPSDAPVMWGACADRERGFRLEAIAVQLCADIAELRKDGGLPAYVRTRVIVLSQQRVLVIHVEGLSIEADPDNTARREVMNALFELAGDHNIIPLDPASSPLFTQQVVLVDQRGRPFAAKVGAGMGEARPLGC